MQGEKVFAEVGWGFEIGEEVGEEVVWVGETGVGVVGRLMVSWCMGRVLCFGSGRSTVVEDYDFVDAENS